MDDQLADGRSFQVFNLIDDFNRKALSMEIELSLPAERVVRALVQVIEWRGKLQAKRSDDSLELISAEIAAWAKKQHPTGLYSAGQPAAESLRRALQSNGTL